jgi:hypothetical protein
MRSQTAERLSHRTAPDDYEIGLFLSSLLSHRLHDPANRDAQRCLDAGDLQHRPNPFGGVRADVLLEPLFAVE